ncbi:MAG: cupin domain-containing protein [Halobacteriales archaeon]
MASDRRPTGKKPPCARGVKGSPAVTVGRWPTAVDLDDAAFVVPETSDVATAFPTDPLGCAGMKANARRLAPGQAVPAHTEGDQEELFVPVRGPASIRIAGERFDTPPGTVARVAPEVPRSAVNPAGTDAVWVMVGAPPTGGPRDWDPGAEVVE